jgi:hypothetical protein
VLTLAICLFPVYPHSCKLLILYSCAGILFLILTLLLSKFFFSISLILDWSFPVSSFLYINILMECYKISLSHVLYAVVLRNVYNYNIYSFSDEYVIIWMEEKKKSPHYEIWSQSTMTTIKILEILPLYEEGEI